jgi:Outer membrane protein beta-barrel domain
MHLFSRWLICTLILLIFLSSCRTCLQASADFAKDKEEDNSAVDELEKTAVNLEVFVEEMVTGIPYSSSVDKSESEIDNGQQSGFVLREGIEYVGKGGKYSQGGTLALNYLELPIYGMYRQGINQSSAVFGGLGPFVSYGIGGKISGGGFSMPSFGENNGGYKRFDAGIGFLVGYQYQDFQFSLNYDLGLVNTAYPSTDITSKTRSFGINVAYCIQKLIKKK